MKKLLLATVASSVVAFAAAAHDTPALDTEIASVEQQLKEVDETISKYEGGLIKAFAEGRREALLLMLTLLQAKQTADGSGAQVDVKMPAVTADPEREAALLGEIAEQLKKIETAEKEAARAGGLIKALALSRVETEKLTLAQLQMGYLQAKYGISFPVLAMKNTDQPEDQKQKETAPKETPKPSETADDSKKERWVFVAKTDDFSDKDASYVILTAEPPIGSDAPEAILVRCDGRGGYDTIVVTNGYIGARDDRVPVRYRFGDSDPISERWSESTNGKAAFLPDGYQDFRRQLASGEDFIFEVTDFRGNRSRSSFKNGKSEKLDFVMTGCK